MKIAFIGIGVMGRSMARHLIVTGHHYVVVYTRRKESAARVLEAGARWCDSVAECVHGAECVITMVGFPKDVEEVYLAPNGIIGNASPGALLIDMTTTKPALAVTIGKAAEARGLKFLDAPVSGGDVGAQNAALSIMVGGCKEVFEQAVPIFQVLGPVGSGQHTKMCNQLAIASGMIGVMESLLYARKAGLDPETVLKSIGSGAAASWSLSNYVPRVLQGNLNPGFLVQHFLKDMDIAIEESTRMGLELPGLKLARQLYQEVADMGGERLGTQSIILALEKRSNITPSVPKAQ